MFLIFIVVSLSTSWRVFAWDRAVDWVVKPTTRPSQTPIHTRLAVTKLRPTFRKWHPNPEGYTFTPPSKEGTVSAIILLIT